MIDQVLRDKLADAYVALIPLITLNLLWLLTSLPIVTIIPASAALLYSTNQIAHGKAAGWSTFFEGFRLYLRQRWAWGWGLLNLVVGVALASNFLFYARANATWTTAALGVVIVLAFLWLTIQTAVFPLMIEQEQPSLRLALRNSLVILIKRPFIMLGTALLIVVFAVATSVIIWPAWAFITASGCAYLANLATVGSIAKITGKSTSEADPELT